MDHLASTLKKGGIKDLLGFYPPQKQDPKMLENHFKAEGVPQIAEWFTKKQFAVIKEGLINGLKQRCEQEDSPEDVSGQAHASAMLMVLRRSSLLSRPSARSAPCLRPS